MSDKQRLQVNNTNLSGFLSEIGDLPLKALVEAAAREGQYVWKKLTAEGGTFVDYVVNDSESAYPDGGTKDGYWYERVSEGIKFSEGNFTTTSTAQNITVPNTLGPDATIVEVFSSSSSTIIKIFVDFSVSYKAIIVSNSGSVNVTSKLVTKSDTSIFINATSIINFPVGTYHYRIIA